MAVRPWLLGALAAALFFFGMRVEAWREDAGTLKATVKTEKVVAHENTDTQSHAVAAVTRDGAIGTGVQAVQNRIQNFHPAANAGKGIDHAPASSALSRCIPLSPLADPSFRVLYDAGSDPHGASQQADPVPTAATQPAPGSHH